MARTRDDFLNDCDQDRETHLNDREAYRKLFADIDALARELGDPEPGDENALGKDLGGLPLRLRTAFNDRKGASLKLQHPKLRGQAALLWFFPSRNVERDAAINRVSAMLSQIAEAGVKNKDADAYSEALQKADFESGGQKSLKTVLAGERGGIARIFSCDANRVAVIAAIRALVKSINTYPPLP